MRRRRSSRELHSVTLFPFLAVLICTFGVLIVLLVIVVKAADQQTLVKREEMTQQHASNVEQLKLKLELQRIRVEGLKSLQPDLLAKLKFEKDRQALYQNEIDHLSSDAELLNRQLERSTTENDAEPKLELENRLVRLRQQLADEKDLLNKKREALAEVQADVKYSIVPYTGPDGTQRKPVYIECREAGLEIQPFGIKLGPKDFVQPVLPNNPLDAALIAIKEYYLKSNLSDEIDSPYPLLIVRPDGANSYALARHALKSWDEEFGYELISSEKKLDYGEGDSQLQEAITLAVDAAKKRQRRYVAEATLARSKQQQFAVRPASGLEASGQFGGFVNAQTRLKQASAESAAQPTYTTSENEKESSGNPGSSRDSDARKQADIAVQGIESVDSIAEKRGRNWALPSKSDNATAYRRPVKIYLSENELIIDSDSQSNYRRTISLNQKMDRATEMLVETIWQRIDSWGIAGVGGYWKPDLEVIVLPGADFRYQHLKRLLDQSGFGITEEKQ